MGERSFGGESPPQIPRPKKFLPRVVENLRNKFFKKEAEPLPLWWINGTNGMQESDKQTVDRLRAIFSDRAGTQHWYYAGSGADITHTFIAPSGTEHHMGDIAYQNSNEFHQPTFETYLVEPFQTLGATVEVSTPWQEAWEKGEQIITIDNTTRLHLTSGSTEDKAAIPPDIDVIYTNLYSKRPGPDAFIALKCGGSYLFCNEQDTKDHLRLRYFNTSFSDFGFEEVVSENIEDLTFPAAGNAVNTMKGKQAWYQVFNKTREFTPIEEDILQFDASLSELTYSIKEYVLRHDHENSLLGKDDQLETELSEVCERYFRKLKNTKSNNDTIISSVEAFIGQYFPPDGIFPEIFKNMPDYAQKDPQRVEQYFSQALKIFQDMRNNVQGT